MFSGVWGGALLFKPPRLIEDYIMVEQKVTTKRFALIVDELVRTKNLTHMEAIIYYCEQNMLEPASVTKWIDKCLKDKIQLDAEKLNYLPKTSQLPL